jgi:hypothetical protein
VRERAVTLHRNDGCLSTISSNTKTDAGFKAIRKKLEDYVTKDQVHDKNYIDKNFIKKDVVGYTQLYISLENKRRIADIKPAITPNDAVNGKQIEQYISNSNP